MGAVVTPESDPLEPQMYKFARKVEAGADFFQTQAVYDMDNFQRFMEQAREITAGTDVKIMAGLVVLTGLGMAKYMNRAVPGIFVPDSLLEEMGSVPKEEALRKGHGDRGPAYPLPARQQRVRRRARHGHRQRGDRPRDPPACRRGRIAS